jgi:penicillin amidase
LIRLFPLLILLTFLPSCREKEEPPQGRFPEIPLKETIRLKGLSRPVEVVRDRLGIPHLYGETDEDLFRVEGYLQAKERFWQIDATRRLARGELSSLFGPLPPVLEQDTLMRIIFLTREGKPQWEDPSLTEREKALFSAFVDGINGYISRVKEGDLPVFYPFRGDHILSFLFPNYLSELPPFRMEDFVAIGRLNQWFLSAYDEFTQIPLLTHFSRRYPEGVSWSLIFSSPGKVTYPFPISSAPFYGSPPFGSNNWVVGPKKTATGVVLLANDPHLQLLNPSVWYPIHMDGKTFGTGTIHVFGGTFPGIPGILLGHNETIAWGGTVLGYQILDFYEETVDSTGNYVWFQNQWVPVKKVELSFPMPGGGVIRKTVSIVPHHGPILPSSPYTSRPLSIRWTGQEKTQDYRAFLNFLTAKDVEEFFSSVTWFSVGAQNFIVGDREGNIGYYGHALVPERRWDLSLYPPYFYLPGTGVAEWSGYLPTTSLPKLKNPSWGFISTANHDIAGFTYDGNLFNDPFYFYFSRDPGFRAQRIEEFLSQETHTVLSMMELQKDTYTKEADLILPHLFRAVQIRSDLTTSYGLTPVLPYLQNWKKTAPTGVSSPFRNAPPTTDEIQESIGASLYYTFIYLLKWKTVFDEWEEKGVFLGDDFRTRSLIYLLNSATEEVKNFVFDRKDTPEWETEEEILLLALKEAVNLLTRITGSPKPENWQWGKIHQLRIYDFLGLIGLPSPDTLGPFPREGGDHTVNVAGGELRSYGFESVHGPSFRLVVELSPEGTRRYFSFPGGNSFDPHSPYYTSFLPLWLRGEYAYIPFTPEEVRKEGRERILFVP